MKKTNSAQKLADFVSKTSQGKSYMTSASTVLLVLVSLLVAIVPGVSATLDQLNKNGEKMSVLSELQRKERNLNTLASQKKSRENLLNVLKLVMPETVFEEGLILSVGEAANFANVIVVSTSFSSVEQRRNLVEVFKVSPRVKAKYVNITGVGSLENFATFISALEANRRIFNIRNINIQLQENAERNLIPGRNYQINVRAEAFYWDLSEIIVN